MIASNFGLYAWSYALALLGVVAPLWGVVHYGRRVRSGHNGRVLGRVGVSLLVGGTASLASVTVALLGGGHVPAGVWVCVGLTSLVSTAMLVLHGQRKVPTVGLTVRVGQSMPHFRAVTPEGELFDASSMNGQRYVLKFFRGEWCPFCQAELLRFDAMRPQLDALQVRVLAISKDPPDAAQRHRARDGLGIQLLCDPDLEVVDLLGLRHRKALEISAGPRLRVFGLAVGSRPTFVDMAAPTTILVDEHGRVAWVDQTDDYKVRSDASRVLSCICRALEPASCERILAMDAGSRTLGTAALCPTC